MCLCMGGSKETIHCPLESFNKLLETVFQLLSGCLCHLWILLTAQTGLQLPSASLFRLNTDAGYGAGVANASSQL